MKTPKITEEDLINLWLEKYHNTNIETILEENPTWKENPNEHTREFYEKYKVTQEQHDEWVIEAKELLRVKLRRSKKYIDKTWWSVYLNCSPSILIKQYSNSMVVMGLYYVVDVLKLLKLVRISQMMSGLDLGVKKTSYHNIVMNAKYYKR